MKSKSKLNKLINYFKQRRVQSAILSAFTVLMSTLGHTWVIPVSTSVAGLLCLHSYHIPKPILKK